MFGNKKNYNDMFRLFDEIFEQINVPGEWKSHTRTSADGTTKVTTHYWSNEPSDTKLNGNVDKLKTQLENAIENEDFELAVALRDKIKNLETNQGTIEKLEKELKQSIQEQNFEKSIKIRDQLRKLKS
jgi:protein-arginine kinase activator protein McsA